MFSPLLRRLRYGFEGSGLNLRGDGWIDRWTEKGGVKFLLMLLHRSLAPIGSLPKKVNICACGACVEIQSILNYDSKVKESP